MKKLIFLLIIMGTMAAHAENISLTLATAGPGNLSHLPVDLIKKIGADKAENVSLEIRYFSGGPLAFKDMLSHNADFAVAGAPALAMLKMQGEPVVSMAAVNLVPTFTLMIHPELKEQIKSIHDLKGRVIGINSSNTQNKSTSQMLTEFVLSQANIPLNSIKFVAAGQTLNEQSAALTSGTVDALMGDEPFASVLQNAGQAVILADFHHPDTSRQLLGGLMLNAQLATRTDMIQHNPEAVKRMARIMQRTLQYIQQHTAEQIVAVLALPEAESNNLLTVLKKHKSIYSPTGELTPESIKTANRFFQSVNAQNPKAQAFPFESMFDTQWIKP